MHLVHDSGCPRVWAGLEIPCGSRAPALLPRIGVLGGCLPAVVTLFQRPADRPLAPPVKVFLWPSLMGCRIFRGTVVKPLTVLSSISVALFSLGFPPPGAMFPLTVRAPTIEFPPIPRQPRPRCRLGSRRRRRMWLGFQGLASRVGRSL